MQLLLNSRLRDICRKLINEILKKYYEGWVPLNKAFKFLPELSKSLTQASIQKLPELNPLVLEAVKLILESNANSLFMESCRAKQDWETFVMICKNTYQKLGQALSTLMDFQTYISKEILLFLDFARSFTKTLGVWGVLQIHFHDLRMEDYSKGKNFKVLSKECVDMGRTLLASATKLKARTDLAKTDIYEFAKFYCLNAFEPDSGRAVVLYEHLHRGEPEVNGETYFFERQESMDYLSARDAKMAAAPRQQLLIGVFNLIVFSLLCICLLYTSPSPRDQA
eukprot:TRINITY_DN1255_c0_g3_i2.p1 TRINITY_DN1255_c0_g3~~TRINITY_DN1255_c0_g3_i2.p1  ORF type:complete len:281 (-),score=62.70 TRINITY_DN1255_c0_g3_i2:50-892(-)